MSESAASLISSRDSSHPKRQRANKNGPIGNEDIRMRGMIMNTRRRRGVTPWLSYAILLALAMPASTAASDLRLSVTPAQRLVMDDVSVVFEGSNPNGIVVIQASFTDESGRAWSSRGEFYADRSGRVDVSRSASIGGTYTGVHPDGLIWSMLPFAPGELDDIDLADRDATWPYSPTTTKMEPIEVTYEASAYTTTGARSPEVVTARHTIVLKKDSVSRTDVEEGELRGVYMEPAKADLRGALLLVTGSGGGAWADRAAWYASHGFAAFAVAHFNYPGRPDHLSLQPLEYFAEAASWLEKKTGAEKLGLIGASRGGEGVLIIASTFPRHFGAVVSIVPSNVVMAGCCDPEAAGASAWTFGGEPLAVPPTRIDASPEDFGDPGFARRWMLDAMLAEGSHVIPVERIRAPLLLVSGGSDALWAGEAAADMVVERLEAHGFSYSVRHLRYSGAGHSVGHPALSTALSQSVIHPLAGTVIPLGGTPAITATASKDALERIVAFLDEHLSAD